MPGVDVPFNLTAKSHPNRVKQIGAPRLINGVAEVVGDTARVSMPIYPREGLTRFSALAGGACRGLYDIDGSYMLALTGNRLSLVDQRGVGSLLGYIPGTGVARFARNRRASPQIACVADGSAFVIENRTVSPLQIPSSSSGFITPIDAAFISGYICFPTRSGQLYFSAIDNVRGLSALNFITAEGAPDGLWRAISRKLELWLFGDDTTEIWAPTGDITAPFSRLSGGFIEFGISAPNSLVEIDERLVWVAHNSTVQMCEGGYQPQEISTPPVARAIEKVADKTSIEGMFYTLAGVSHYVLSCADWTWDLNMSTKSWTERDTFGSSRWRASHCVRFGSKPIAGDVANANLYVIDEGAWLDDDLPIVVRTTLPPVSAFPSAISFFNVRVDLASDAPASDEPDPVVRLRWSDDGGRRWSPYREKRLSPFGERMSSRFNQLGQSKDIGRTFEIVFHAAPGRALAGVVGNLGQVSNP